MTGFGNNKKSEKKIKKGEKTDNFEAQFINKAFLLHSQGNILEAEKYYRYCIEQKINDYRIFSNYGLILKNLLTYSHSIVLPIFNASKSMVSLTSSKG